MHNQSYDPSVPTIDKQLAYWKYWQRMCSDGEVARERMERMLRILADLKLDRPRILDFGCGTGWFTEQLSQFGEATGIDLNEEAMCEARLRWPHVCFIGGDLFKLSLPVSSFDVVVSMQVIAHVEDQEKYLDKVTDLLKPGGYLMLSTNNKFVMDRLGDLDWGNHRSQGHIENWLSLRSLKQLLHSRLQLRYSETMIPLGNGGILRIVDSHKVNAFAERFISPTRIRRLKERLGLGYYLVVVAQKPRKTD